MKNSLVVEKVRKTKEGRTYKMLKHSGSWKEAQSERMKGVNNPNFGKVYSLEERRALSEKCKGIVHPPQSEESLVRGSIAKSKYSYNTPYGHFLSIKLALAGVLKATCNVMDRQLLVAYCKKDLLITFHKGTSHHLYFKKEDRGRTTTELGWSLVRKEH